MTSNSVNRNFGLLNKLETVIQNQSGPASRGLQLFYLCKEQAESPIWHNQANIASNFHGKHGILMVHIWMVNKRLLLLPDTAARAEVQETLFDTLWADTMARIRANGVAEISVNARLKDVQSWSLPTCLELDYAFSLLNPEVRAKAAQAKEKPKSILSTSTTDTDTDTTNSNDLIHSLPAGSSDSDLVIDHIAGTLWRQVYQRDEITDDMLEQKDANGLLLGNGIGNAGVALREKTPEDVVTDLASYIFHEYQSLEFDITDSDFNDGLFRFGQVPERFGSNAATFVASAAGSGGNKYSSAAGAAASAASTKYDMRSTRRMPNKTDRWMCGGGGGIVPPPGGIWKPIMHVDGKIYYWNTETFDSTWQKPSDNNA